MELFDQFGFDPKLFIAQIINFLILAFIFKRFLYKPLLKVIRDREQKITQGLSDAEKAEKALRSAEEEREVVLKKASLEAEEILKQTQESAEDARAKILSKTKAESEKMIEDAKNAAKAEFENMQKEIRGISLKLSEEIQQKSIEHIFTKEEQEKIIKRNIEQLKNDKK